LQEVTSQDEISLSDVSGKGLKVYSFHLALYKVQKDFFKVLHGHTKALNVTWRATSQINV